MKCTCIIGYGNTGVPNCQVIIDVTKQTVLTPYFKSDGSINGIDLSAITELTQAFIDGKLQAIDPNERWYPTPEMKNITDERAEDIVESFDDGTSVKIQDGARTFVGLIVGQAPELKGKLDEWACETMGYYAIDKSGNLVGDNSRAGFLDPIKVQNKSLSTIFVKTTDTTTQKIQLSFIIDQLMNDANISMINSADITGVLSGIGGLIDCTGVDATAITTTGFTAKMATGYGTALNPTLALGLAVDDFGYRNLTSPSGIEDFTSVTETEGTYAFVYDTPVSASDEIEILHGNVERDKGFEVVPFKVVTP